MSLTFESFKRCLFGCETRETRFEGMFPSIVIEVQPKIESRITILCLCFTEFVLLKGVKQWKWAQTLWGLKHSYNSHYSSQKYLHFLETKKKILISITNFYVMPFHETSLYHWNSMDSHKNCWIASEGHNRVDSLEGVLLLIFVFKITLFAFPNISNNFIDNICDQKFLNTLFCF